MQTWIYWRWTQLHSIVNNLRSVQIRFDYCNDFLFVVVVVFFFDTVESQVLIFVTQGEAVTRLRLL